AVDLDEAVVHPAGRVGDPGGRFALRDLVLVVREDEVEAAAMKIEGLAEVLHRHRGALDVPSGATAAEGAVPGRALVLAALPQDEVGGVALALPLALVEPLARAGLHLLEVAVAELAVVGEAAHREVHVAVALVRVAALDEACDEVDDFRDVLRDLRLDVGRDVAEPLHVFAEGRGELLRERSGAHAAFGGALEDLVVDVRVIAYEGDLHAALTQTPNEDVIDDVAARVAEVGVVVDGGTADVEPRV